MKNSWVLFTALRHFKTKRRSRGDTSTVLSVMGIMAGVLTMIVVIGVMNGFQSGPIDNLIEIGSSHIKLIKEKDEVDSSVIESLKEKEWIHALYESSDVVTVAARKKSSAISLKSLPVDILQKDPRFQDLSVTYGKFDLSEPNSIVLGWTLAYELGVRPGGKISIVMLKSPSGKSFKAEQVEFTVTGLFSAGYGDFDSAMGFISNESALEYFVNEKNLNYHIKIADKDDDLIIKKRLLETEGVSENFSVKTWRDFNKAYFSSLKNEKIVMMILTGLIFVIVGFNVYNSLRRSVYLRFEEISVLKTLGATSLHIKSVFILESFFTGLTGASLGLAGGLLLSWNISSFFEFLDLVINGAITGINALLSLFNGAVLQSVSIYSPDQFYLVGGIPIKIYISECLFIFLSALLSTVVAAYGASRRVSTIKPGEVLRYE